MPDEWRLLKPCFKCEGLEEVRTDHEVIGVDGLAVVVDELVGEVLRIILAVLEVLLGEGQHGVMRNLGRGPPRHTTDDVPHSQMT